MIVTTAEKPDEAMRAKAARLADELGVPYRERRGYSVAGMQRHWSEDNLLVVGREQIKLVTRGGDPLFYHPSMALIRLKKLLAGGEDRLLQAAQVRKGDQILDCTAGMCADALVLSYAVGTTGRVVAMESSPILHAVIREGMAMYSLGIPELDEALRRLQLVRNRYEEHLKMLANDSFDIIYFDPMFERPVHASSALQPLRQHAEQGALSEAALAEAKRVARKRIVLKDHRDSGQFERLGFALASSAAGGTVAYGVIEIE